MSVDALLNPAQVELVEQASKVPFDDRRCLGASPLDISPTLVRRHLHHSGSHLAEAPLSDEELYRKLRLLLPVNAHAEPRNAALLFFHEEPTRFFPGARIELCEFPEGRGGDVLRERTFSGPLPEQIRACQSHLEGLLGSLTRKLDQGAEARRTVSSPRPGTRRAGPPRKPRRSPSHRRAGGGPRRTL